MSMPLADPGLAVEHAGEVEAHDLAPGLGDGVLGEHAWSLARDQPRRGLPAASSVSGSAGLVRPRRRACVTARRAWRWLASIP